MTRRYDLYINDILEAIDNIGEYTKEMSFEKFEDDKKTIDAVIRNFEVIGEATKNIPSEIQLKYNTIPWKDMARLRDKLIHQYFGIKLNIVWLSINEILSMKLEIERILLEENLQ